MKLKTSVIALLFLLLISLTACAPFGGQSLDERENLRSPEPYTNDFAEGDNEAPLEEGINWDISSESTSLPSNKYPETKAIQVQEAKFVYVVDGQVQVDKKDIPAQLKGYSPEQIQQAIRGQLNGITETELNRLSPEKLQAMIKEQTQAPAQGNKGETTTAPKQAAPTKQETAQPKKETPAPAPSKAAPKPKNQPAPVKPAEQPKQDTAKAPVQTAGISAIETKVIELTNVERRNNGLSDLQGDTQLSGVARKKSTDMQQNNYFSHTSPTYGSPFDMMRDHGVNYSAAAENIAQGQKTAEEVVQAWMNSEGHRKNILNGNFTHIGVGYDQNGHHWTQMFIKK